MPHEALATPGLLIPRVGALCPVRVPAGTEGRERRVQLRPPGGARRPGAGRREPGLPGPLPGVGAGRCGRSSAEVPQLRHASRSRAGPKPLPSSWYHPFPDPESRSRPLCPLPGRAAAPRTPGGKRESLPLQRWVLPEGAPPPFPGPGFLDPNPPWGWTATWSHCLRGLTQVTLGLSLEQGEHTATPRLNVILFRTRRHNCPQSCQGPCFGARNRVARFSAHTRMPR